MHCISWY